MRAVRLVEPNRPLVMEDVPVPETGPEDVLVRVKAAGICRSDLHYRAGSSPAGPLPVTLGHEVAGLVERVGSAVGRLRPGDRVSVHYLVTCGRCGECLAGREQFCAEGAMIGKHRDGGFADYIAVPARNALPLPAEVPFEHGAVLMCSSATVFHALRRARVSPGERVAVFGVGGLGMSAVQLARVFGAVEVFAADIDAEKLRRAEALGAVPVDNSTGTAADEILRATGGRGVDVALELVGLSATTRQAIRVTGVGGRAVVVGLGKAAVEVVPYIDLIGREVSVIGSNDHLAGELPVLLALAAKGMLDLSPVVTGTVPLEAGEINRALDRLEVFEPGTVRTVVVPEGS